MDPYLGCVILFGGNFEIYGFKFCNGQILPIQQYAALFSLLGTYYGGNGTSNFALPDLRGRTVIQQAPAGLSDYVLGEQTGVATATLTSSNIPSHSHNVNAITAVDAAAAIAPTNALFAEGPKVGGGISAKAPLYYITGTAANTKLNPLSVGVNVGGGSTPFNVMQPYLAVTHLIALTGVFPARS